MLEISNLGYTTHNHCLIKEISLQFTPGALYGILGPNGSGKSTLLRSIAGIWPPTEGKILWQKKNLNELSRLAISQIMSLVPQNPQLFFDFEVYTMVAMGCYSHGYRSTKTHQKVEKALHQVNAWHLQDRILSELSGGERQRIYIARALATEAPILLLDEPTSHLDLRHQLEIWHLLRALVKEGKLIITAVHDLLTAERFCDQLVILNHGRCQGKGSYEEVMTPHLLRDIFGVSHHDASGSFELYTKTTST